MNARFAMVVDWTRPSISENLAVVTNWAVRAADAEAHLVLFPEAALTGLVNNDDPTHDLPLCCCIPGDETASIRAAAQRLGIYIGLGMLEREGAVIYDSAVLIDPSGEIVLVYRRIQPCWHGREADPHFYRQGSDIPMAQTPFGSLAFLLCGDLFDDQIVDRLRNLAPDYLLFPFARTFGGACLSQADWAQAEEGVYAARAARCGCTTLMVNGLMPPQYCDGPSFGGAMVVSPDGQVLARLPLREPGMLLWERE